MHLQNPLCRGLVVLFAALYAVSPAAGVPLSVPKTASPTTLDLNLSSSQGSILATSTLAGTTIHLGSANHALSITTGQLLTPAEYVAALQVLNSGNQTLLLGLNGSAVGGAFRMTSALSSLNGLVIPKNVTALDYFAGHSTLSVATSINDYGSLLGIAKPGSLLNITTGNLNIFPTGSISALSTRPSTAVNLSIYSAGNIENAGLISSTGRLQLTAAGSIANDSGATISGAREVTIVSGDGQITNNGTISSQTGNLLLSTAANAGLLINNESGLLQAASHSVIFDAGNNSNSIQLTGGDVIAKAIDFSGRSSDLQVNADNLQGVVNVDTKSAHVATVSAFNLGNLDVSGDPTFDITGGPFTFTKNMTVPLGQALTVIAQGSINANKGVTQIKSTGGALTLICGVNSTHNAGGNDTVNSITALSPSIDLGFTNLKSGTSASGGFGGVILLVAPNGSVRVGNIDSSARAGTGGSVTLQSPNLISTGSITTSGKTGGGAVELNTGPVSLTGPANYDDTTGIPQQVADPFSSGAVSGGAVFVNGGITSSSKGGPGGAVTITTANQIRVNGNINSSSTAGGNSLAFPHTGGTISLSSSHDTLTVLGSVTASGQHDGTTQINLTADTGLDVSGNVVATGAIHGGNVNVNVDHIGDIRLGVNSVDNNAPGTNPLIVKKTGGVNVSSSQGPGGSVQIEAHSGTVYIGKSVNASGSNSGGTINLTGLEHLLVQGTVTSNASDGAGGHIQITATGFSTPNLLFGMDTGAVSATGKLAGGVIQLDAENTPMLVRGGLNVSSTAGSAGFVQTFCLLDTTIKGSVLSTGPHNSGPTGISLNAGLSGGAVVNPGVLTVAGPINTSSKQGAGGFVGLLGQTGITVGAITTSGFLAGGQITADSADGILTVNGNINTSSGNVKDSSGPGNAGNVLLNSGTLGSPANTGAATFVNGNIIAKGGNALGVIGPGQGGGGGTVDISTALDNGFQIGTVRVGSIDTRGGSTTNTLGLAGGAGGAVNVFGATVQFTKKAAGGASVNTTGGADPFKQLTNGGAIDIATFGLQPVPRDLNLASQKLTDFALPGAMFQVGNASVNGSAGIMLSNTGSTANKVGNGMITAGASAGNISISETFSSATYDRGSTTGIPVGPTTTIAGKTVRTAITPAEALALYQTTRGLTQTFGLTNEGGAADFQDLSTSLPNNITIQVPAEFSKNFTAFYIQTQNGSPTTTMLIEVNVNDTTPSVYIGLPKHGPSNIDQAIIIKDNNSTKATVPALADIHAGSAPIDVSASGAIVTSPDNHLPSGPSPNLRFSAIASLNIALDGGLQGGIVGLQAPKGIKVTADDTAQLTPFALEISGATGMQVPTGTFSFLSTGSGGTGPQLSGISTIFTKGINVAANKPGLDLPNIQFSTVQYWNIYGPISIKGAGGLLFGTGIGSEIDHLYALGPINIQMFPSSSSTTFLGDMQIVTQSSFSLFSTSDIKSPTSSSSFVQITCGTNLSLITQGALNDGNGNATWQFDTVKGTMVLGSNGVAFTPVGSVSLTSVSDQFTSFGNMSIFAPGVIVTGNGASGPGYQCETGTLSIGSYQTLGIVNHANDQIGGFFEAKNVVMNLGSTTSSTSVDPTIAGNFRISGSITVNFHGNNTFGVIDNGAALDAGKGVSIFGDDNITILSAEIFSAGGTVSIKTPSTVGANIDIGSNALIGAGSAAFGCCSLMPITKADVLSAGNLDIEAGGHINIGTNGTPTSANFRTTGGNIVLKSFTGSGISLGDQTFFRAFGGNIEILSEDGVQGGSTTSGGPPGNRFEAVSLVNGKSITGGGVEIRGNTTVSTISQLISHRPHPFSNQIDASQLAVVSLGSSPNTKGEVLIGSTATVTLNSTSLPGTAMIIGGQNSVVAITGNVTLDSVLIGSATPISKSESDAECSDLIVDADIDDE